MTDEGEWLQVSFGNITPTEDYHQYRYWTHSARADHARFRDEPEHHLGYRARKTVISGLISYRGRCLCGDEQDEWVRPKKRIERWHERHLAAVRDQQLPI